MSLDIYLVVSFQWSPRHQNMMQSSRRWLWKAWESLCSLCQGVEQQKDLFITKAPPNFPLIQIQPKW